MDEDVLSLPVITHEQQLKKLLVGFTCHGGSMCQTSLPPVGSCCVVGRELAGWWELADDQIGWWWWGVSQYNEHGPMFHSSLLVCSNEGASAYEAMCSSTLIAVKTE